MKGIYFEEKGIELIGKLGMSKAEFARRMGIQRQNVNVLFKTNNLEIIARAAEVLGGVGFVSGVYGGVIFQL